MTEKLREYFDDMVVFKDLKNNSVFASLGLPSFTRDWLLRKFEDDEGSVLRQRILNFYSLMLGSLKIYAQLILIDIVSVERAKCVR